MCVTDSVEVDFRMGKGIIWFRQAQPDNFFIVPVKIHSKIGAFTIIFLLLAGYSLAQPKRDSILFASQIKIFSYLDPFLKMYVDEKGNGEWPSLEEYKRLPDNYIDRAFRLEQTLKTHYFLFTLRNDTREPEAFFVYCSPQEEISVRSRSIHLKQEISLKPTTFSDKDEIALYPIQIMPGDTLKVQLRTILSRHPLNLPFYYIVPGDQVNEFEAHWSSMFAEDKATNFWMVGMMLMMGIYILIKYLQIRAREYLFYAGYIFFMVIFFVLKITQLNYSPIFSEQELLYSVAYRGTQSAAYCMYFAFFQYFFSTRESLPLLHRQLRWAIIILVAYMLLDLMLTIPHADSRMLLQYRLWDVVRIVLMVWVVYSLSFISFYRAKLSNPRLVPYVMAGVSALLALALISMIFSINQGIGIAYLPGPLMQPIFYFQLGIVAELLFFSAGLGYKNRMDEIGKVKALEALKQEEERSEFMKYKAGIEAREAERIRIAKDLHDGVGGLLSGVRFALEGIRARVGMQAQEEVLYDKSLNQLGETIHELRKVAHDLMPDILLKHGLNMAVRDYCQSLNDLGVLHVVFQQVGEERRLKTDSEIALYRVVQELLTNATRHSKASEALVQLVFTAHKVSITVEDNGVGFEVAAAKGNGLSNIHSRVEQMMGKVDIKSLPGEGTSVYIEVPA